MSIPTNLRFNKFAAMPVVLPPANGSRIQTFGLVEAKIMRLGTESGFAVSDLKRKKQNQYGFRKLLKKIGLSVCNSLKMIVFLIEKLIMNTSFERGELTKVEWLTPPELVKKLGEFDLDPCCPIHAPFYHAKVNYTIEDNGLKKDWFGRVFCNPPYGNQMNLWLEKLKRHGNGIAVIFARTETRCFFENIWYAADALLFIKGRIKFFHVSGIQGGTSGAPSVFVAYGKENALALKNSGIEGRFLEL